MRGFTIFAVGLALFAESPAAAQEALNPSPRAQELAARYVEIFDLRRIMVEQYTGASELSDEMMAGIEALGVPMKGDDAMTSMPTFMPDGSLETMEPMLELMESVMVQAVAETYPEAELEALVAFYDTEVGRSIMNRQGALQLRMTGLMFERMPELLAVMGVDPDTYGALYGLGGGYGEAPSPTREMRTGSTPAYGMSLNDIMIYGAAEADAAMAGTLEDHDH